MFDRLEQFLVRITRSRFQELLFVVVSILVLLGLSLLGNFLAGRVGWIVAAILWGVPFSICVVVLNRGLARRRTEESAQSADSDEEFHRLPREFVLVGLLCFALYALAWWGARWYPVIHPIDGEIWAGFALMFALASGFMLVGLAGFIDERITFAIIERARKRSLPFWAYLAGWTLLVGGLAGGGYVVFLMSG